MLRFILMTIFLSITCTCAMAAPPVRDASKLASVTFEVGDRSSQALRPLLKKGFEEVLVRLSGNTAVTSVPDIVSASGRVNRFVERYSYKKVRNAEGGTKTLLTVVFDRQGIVSLLQKSGQAVWLRQRAKTLIWLYVDGSVLSDASASHPMAVAMKEAAQKRGVDILFPVMDLDDEAALPMQKEDLSDVDDSRINAIKKRYHVDSVLVGYATTLEAGQLGVTWFFNFHHQPFRWKMEGADGGQLAAKGLSHAVDILANQLAVVNTKALLSTVLLSVNGIQSLESYADMVQHLKKLSAVAHISVNKMSADHIVLRVDTVGGEQALVSALQGQSWIAPLPIDHDQGGDIADLYYRLLPDTQET